MDKVGEKAKIASVSLSSLTLKKRNDVLRQYCIYLKMYTKSILSANKRDLLKTKKNKKGMLQRLILDENKIKKIIKSVKEIIKFKDPLGKTLALWRRPNGLVIKKISIPIGVIATIYESRPNVTSDVSSLCFKSGNVVILRGGSDAFFTNKILSNLFRKALKKKNCNENCVQFINKKNREYVDYLLSKMQNYVDIIIPRGRKSLVKKVKKKS